MEVYLQVINKVFEPYKMKLTSFPGNLPSTLTHKEFFQIAFGYRFSLKANGFGNHFQILNGDCFLINRALQVHKMGLFDIPSLYVFDVEWIPSNNLILLFDVLLFQSKSCIALNYSQRVELLRMFCHKYGTFQQTVNNSHFPTHQVKIQQYLVEPKPIYDSFGDIYEAWQHRYELPYPVDGIICTRDMACYTPFCMDPHTTLKWKDVHTLDFQIRPRDEIHPDSMLLAPDFCRQVSGNVGLYCLKDELTLFSYAWMQDTTPCVWMKDTTPCVGEFMWQNNHWVFMLYRPEKRTPNTWTTIANILEAIEFPISIENWNVSSSQGGSTSSSNKIKQQTQQSS